MPPRIPSPYKPARPALIEPIRQPLYSSNLITGAAPENQLLFFQNTQGSAGQTPITTNMETAGQLSNPKIFVIDGLRMDIAQRVVTADATGLLFDDLCKIAEIYWFRLFIGTKEYLRVASKYLSSGIGAWLSAAGNPGAGNVLYTSNLGVPVHTNYFRLKNRIITIPPQQNFQTELNLGVAGVTLSANRRVWHYLEGSLGREVM
jgi:hypothetical protein